MSHKDELKYIKEHFDKIDRETLISDLIECGLGSIKDPSDSGAISLSDESLYEYEYTVDSDWDQDLETEMYYNPDCESFLEAA
jgi:hypothetical protein